MAEVAAVGGPEVAVGLTRKTPMKRGKLNPVNRKRRVSEFVRCYGGKARVRFVRALPCAACGVHDPAGCDNAHTENGGAGRKGDAETIISLCRRCHTKHHQSGWMAIGMTEEGRRRAAALTQELWEAYRGRGEEAD